MRNHKRRMGTRLALVGLVVAGSVSVVLAHTYRLEPSGEFILADDDGKRRLVVTKGTTFQVGVLDTGGCTADIRAVGGNRRVASVSNPRSQGFVEDQVFNFRANRAGTTTYTITVRGEAFNGGDPVCDEDSRNPLEISVVDAAGSDKPFARAIRPEIRSATNLLNQLRANLRRQLAEIRAQFLKGQIDAPTLFVLTSVQMSAALFEQFTIARDFLDDMRENEKQRLLSNPVTANLPVPNGLLAGTCGAWDRLVDQMNGLLRTQRGRSKTDLKRHFATIVRNYERQGGYLLWSADYCDYPRIGGGFGVSFDDYEKTPRERVRNNLIVSYAFAEPDSTTVNRGLVLGLEATSGINSVRTTIRDDDGDLDTIDTQVPILGRIPVLHRLFSRDFGQRVTVDISPDGDPDRIRSRRTSVPLILVTPRIIIQEEEE